MYDIKGRASDVPLAICVADIEVRNVHLAQISACEMIRTQMLEREELPVVSAQLETVSVCTSSSSDFEPVVTASPAVLLIEIECIHCGRCVVVRDGCKSGTLRLCGKASGNTG